jgi:hypothetical protein
LKPGLTDLPQQPTKQADAPWGTGGDRSKQTILLLPFFVRQWALISPLKTTPGD